MLWCYIGVWWFIEELNEMGTAQRMFLKCGENTYLPSDDQPLSACKHFAK